MSPMLTIRTSLHRHTDTQFIVETYFFIYQGLIEKYFPDTEANQGCPLLCLLNRQLKGGLDFIEVI